MKLGDKIHILRKERNMTMQTLADKSNLTKGYISMLEKGKNPQSGKEIVPSLETVQNIALAFHMDLETLLKDTQNEVALPKLTTSTLTLITDTASQLNEDRQMNVLEYAEEQLGEQNRSTDEIQGELYPYEITEKLAAASGLPNGYPYDSDHNEKHILYSDKLITTRYDIASEVTGDSMEPRYNDSDVVLIQKGFDNDNGAVYAVDYDGKTYLKKVYLEDNQFKLVSINEKYDDIYIDLPVDEAVYFNIVGKVVDNFTPVEM
ncbi:helix-turn-helix transcriptional regulator [Aerococcaceae bacterium zg-BR22]|uniref:XRE family transcriptional regulator n=1 Tax=Aerococcaceae bacterium zg-1292 TaxID=2774330 RepID=UPI004063B030|nr:helix-turn-helix transcriptional regulator [Aerococcaceae bacterium zg-BR22]